MAINACSPGRTNLDFYNLTTPNDKDFEKNPQSYSGESCDDSDKHDNMNNTPTTPLGPQDMTLRKPILTDSDDCSDDYPNRHSLRNNVRFSENIGDDEIRERKTIIQNQFLALAKKT